MKRDQMPAAGQQSRARVGARSPSPVNWEVLEPRAYLHVALADLASSSDAWLDSPGTASIDLVGPTAS